MSKTFYIIIGILIIIVAAWWFGFRTPKNIPVSSVSVSYACNNNKTIDAVLYEGTSTPPAEPGKPPIPSGSAKVALSDGRVMTLPRTLSADGVRYANADESFVFWSKGNGALVLENNVEKSYIGCVVVKPNVGGLDKIYQNGTEGISIRYPLGFIADASYRYTELGPGKDIYGVKFTIPESLATGTNLSDDSYISIESIPNQSACSAKAFLDSNAAAESVSDNGTEYSFASTTGAAAGNRYEETVYALPGTNPCIAVRYLVHYGVFENYEPGTVKRFDREALMNTFDAIRRSLTVNQ